MLFSCILWRGKAVGARKKQNSRNPEKRISAIFAFVESSFMDGTAGNTGHLHWCLWDQ